MRFRDAVRIGLAVMAMFAAAAFAAAQANCHRPPCNREVCPTVIVCDGPTLATAQQAPPVIPPPSYPSPLPEGCAGCSPGAARALLTDPYIARAKVLRCAQAYRDASSAIDSVYGVLPGVVKDEQLQDSLALTDAAGLIVRDPKAQELFCPVEKVQELEQLTAEFLAAQGQLVQDSKARQRTEVNKRAAQALRDMGRWLPTL